MSWKKSILICCFIAVAFLAKSQNAVGIGVVNPNKNAVLELVSPNNNQGFLAPRLSTSQRTATTFTSALSAKENGLLIFDSDENKFYFWQNNQWQPVRTGADLNAGTGVAISGNVVSAVPQDLKLVGKTLSITNNPSATPINLAGIQLTAGTGVNIAGDSVSVIPQDLKLSGTTLSITNNPTATPISLASLQLTAGSGVAISGNTISTIPQDLQLVGSTLTITNSATATPVNLSAFTGTNTDDQTLSFNAATGQVSITRLTGGPQNITLTGIAPGGAASGDFAGSYPSPTIAPAAGDNILGAINNIATTGTINSNRLNPSVVLDTESPTGGDISGTYATGLTLNNNSVTISKIAPGSNGQVLTTAAGVVTWVTGTSPSGSAGGDLIGTYPNPSINTGAITSGKILDGTITSADLASTTVTAGSYGSATTVPNFTVDAQGRLTAASSTTIAGVSPGGTAGGDLTGTYPNPTINTGSVTSTKILDGTIAAIDITADAITSGKILDGTITSADLASTTVTAGSYGSATTVPNFTELMRKEV